MCSIGVWGGGNSRTSFCSRGGARAGGEAPLAVQGIPAGAQRVPAAPAQTTQVSLLSHVTTPAGPVERGRGINERKKKMARQKNVENRSGSV